MVTFDEELARELGRNKEGAINAYAAWTAYALHGEDINVSEFTAKLEEHYQTISEADNPYSKMNEIVLGND